MGLFEDVGNFLSDVGDAVADGAEAVGDGVETVVNAVGEFASDIVETAGNGIQDGFNAVGNFLGQIPFIGGFIKGFDAWLGAIIAGVTNFIGAVLKGITGIIGGILGGLVKIIGGLITFHWDVLLEGLLDIWNGIAGVVVSILGTLLSLLHRLLPFINQDRPLTKEEKSILGELYQRSLALYNIRIKSTSGMVQTTFTLNNTIYTNAPNLALTIETLVHESVHVWQYQTFGSCYLSEAIGAQWIYGRSTTTPCVPGEAYDWIAELNRGTTDWLDFNREAQAQLIEEVWIDGTLTSLGTTETGRGAFFKKENCEAMIALLVAAGPLQPASCSEVFVASDIPQTDARGIPLHCPRDGKDYTPLANDAKIKIRAPWNFRLSQVI